MKINSQSDFKRIVYVFQGGGALGAYQVGVFKALREHKYEPDWVIGTSIGAINASIIAGTPPETRVMKLLQFWNAITHSLVPPFSHENEILGRLFNFLSAERSILVGNDNFFYPRINSPLFAANSTPDQISFYITQPLKDLLMDLIDFDLINSGKMRLTIAAVEIKHGKTVYFDNQKDTITIDHIMASAALPPGFPAVEINGKYYWDGGVLNNAPVMSLLNEPNTQKTLCFGAQLFDSFGLLPENLDDVLKRHKDITYSCHFKTHMDVFKIIHGLRSLCSKCSEHLPEELLKNPLLKEMIDLNKKIEPIHFVRFLYQAPAYELSSKDYEFSNLSMHERLETGFEDATSAIKNSPWLNDSNEKLGISIHEFYRDLEKLVLIQKDD